MQSPQQTDQPALKCCGLLIILPLLLGLAWTVYMVVSLPSLVHQKNFTRGEEAKELVGLGWLPSWFPTGARDIHHAHDLDINLSQTRFSLSAQDFDKLGSVCKRGELRGKVWGSYLGKEVWDRKVIQKDIRTGRALAYSCADPDTTSPQVWNIVRSGEDCYLWNVTPD